MRVSVETVNKDNIDCRIVARGIDLRQAKCLDGLWIGDTGLRHDGSDNSQSQDAIAIVYEDEKRRKKSRASPEFGFYKYNAGDLGEGDWG